VPSWDGDAGPSWHGAELLIPPSPDARRGGPLTRLSAASLADMLPSPGLAFGRAPSAVPTVVPTMEPSPFSPTKKLRAMSLRSARGEGPGGLRAVAEAPPPKPGDLLPAQQHRIKQAVSLWEVHTGMGGTGGAAWASILRREFAAVSEGERAQIQQAVAKHVQQTALKDHIEQRAWTADEKAKLVTLFHVIDADEGGSISRHEFLEIASLAGLGRAELGRAFDHAVLTDRRRTARTPGGTVELTLAQFTRLIENLDDGMLRAIRAILPGLVEKREGKESLLVFDDGRQQMWRLVPGGRALVRKPVTKKTASALSQVEAMLG